MTWHKLILYFDVFGVGYNFLIEGEDKYRTFTGALLTIFYCLIVAALFFGFGIDLYQRKNPKVSLNTEIVPYSKFVMSNSNFTLAYRVEDQDGKIFLDESIVYPKVFYISYEMTNGTWNTNFIEVMEKKRCHDLPGYEDKEVYFNISLQNWYCIDFENRTWGGNWDGNFVYYFQVNIEQCLNSTENNNNCSSENIISESFINSRSLGNLYYSQMTMSVQPAMNDFSQPLKPYLVNYYSTLNLDLSKKKIQNFKITSVNNDIGWFFEEIKINSVFTMDYAEPDFTLKKKFDQPIVFSTTNYLGNQRDTYYRTYTKIQEVIASVGGFAKFFYTCIFLVYHYAQKVYRNLIIINKINFNTESFVKKDRLKNESFIKINNLHSLQSSQEILQTFERSKNEIKVKFSHFICHKICRKKFTQNLNSYLDRYPYYGEYISEKFEILSFIRIFNEFENLKRIILNEEQINHISTQIPKIYPNKEQKNLEEEVVKDNTQKNDRIQHYQNYIIRNHITK
jgi:hypothetical protein